MIKVILKYWFKVPEKLRFLLVGGWNTLFSLLLFSFILILIDNYKITLIISHLCSVLNSFLTFKFFVFRSSGMFLFEYIKINLVYLLHFVLNFIMLYVSVEMLKMNVIVSQIIITCILTIINYFLNKNFTFKNGKVR
jgi:putative flippase GtrA